MPPPGAEVRGGGTPVQCELEASALPSHWEGDTSGRVALCEWAASFPTGEWAASFPTGEWAASFPTGPNHGSSAAAAVKKRANATIAKETMVVPTKGRVFLLPLRDGCPGGGIPRLNP